MQQGKWGTLNTKTVKFGATHKKIVLFNADFNAYNLSVSIISVVI